MAMMSTVRVSSGISGIDEMLKGGFIPNKIILLRGGPGTGKTIFSLQYLTEGAKKGQKGLYVTLEEPLESIRKTSANLGFDLEKYEKQNLIKTFDGSEMVYKFSEEKRGYEAQRPVISSIVNQMNILVKDFGAKRLVIDPITSAIIHQRFPTDKRLEILELMKGLRKMDCTSLITSESASSSEDDFFVEEYLADGVVILSNSMRNFAVTKTVWVEKMRGLKHDDQPRKYEISDKGIVVYATEPVTV
jgi:KaiC/GvpD/RAD55 family RecA-like ATPase